MHLYYVGRSRCDHHQSFTSTRGNNSNYLPVQWDITQTINQSPDSIDSGNIEVDEYIVKCVALIAFVANFSSIISLLTNLFYNYVIITSEENITFDQLTIGYIINYIYKKKLFYKFSLDEDL